MSESDLLQRFMSRDARAAASHDLEHEQDADDLGSFGWLRGTRDRAVMLELRKKDGNVLAIGYGWLERVQFDPSEGITLWAAGQKILLKGRNLNAEVRATVRLFDGIIRHRVPWVQEADRTRAMQAADADAVIDKIEW